MKRKCTHAPKNWNEPEYDDDSSLFFVIWPKTIVLSTHLSQNDKFSWKLPAAKPFTRASETENYSTIFRVFYCFCSCFYYRENFLDFQISFVLASFASYTISRTLWKSHGKLTKKIKQHTELGAYLAPRTMMEQTMRMGKNYFSLCFTFLLLCSSVLSTLL